MVDGKAILVVAAGDAKIDNPKYKAQFGTKAKMLTPNEVEDMVGHAVGEYALLAFRKALQSIWMFH